MKSRQSANHGKSGMEKANMKEIDLGIFDERPDLLESGEHPDF